MSHRRYFKGEIKMYSYILTDLESLIKAPKKERLRVGYYGTFRNKDFEYEEFANNKRTFEVTEEVIDNMSKKQMREFINSLINDKKFIRWGIDETSFFIHLKDIVVLIFADVYADFSKIENVANYVKYVQIHYMEKVVEVSQ